jgi:DNA replication and repair protein RecF
MRFTHIRLRNFRNHADTFLDLGRVTNVLVGQNGEGKTNILEAVSYLCLTKSFYAGSDSVVVSFGKEKFEVEGSTASDAGIETTIQIAYSQTSTEKVYAVNKRRVEPLSSAIGRFPIVILSPEHAPVTAGAPSDRRKFVDLVISQSSRPYFEDLLEYRRVLKHRNRVLLDARLTKSGAQLLLEPWDEQLIRLGARLTEKRRRFVDEFQSFVASSYRQITEGEEPSIEYAPGVELGEARSLAEVEESLRRGLMSRRREETQLGTTLVGPHRDEFVLKIGGLDLRKFASQGQHKTFLIALKVGEFFYLKERRGETPAMLMDDVFGELDEQRSIRVLECFETLGQTFITATQSHIFDSGVVFGEQNRKFLVTNGSVVYETVKTEAN